MHSRVLLLLAFGNFRHRNGGVRRDRRFDADRQFFRYFENRRRLGDEAYGLFYAVTSPPLVALTGASTAPLLMVAGLVIFLCGALLACAAPSFAILLVARALMRWALESSRRSPLSIGAALVALSTAAGRWRRYLAASRCASIRRPRRRVARLCLWLAHRLLGGRAAVGHRRRDPVQIDPAQLKIPATSLGTLGEVLATPRLILAIAMTGLFFAALYAPYTYLGAFLEARHGLGRDGVTMALMIFGVAAVIGNGLGGLLTDRIGPVLTLTILCVAECAIMPFLTLVATPLYATLATLAIWSMFSFAFMAAAASAARGARSAENVDIVRAQCFGHLSWRIDRVHPPAARRSNSSARRRAGPSARCWRWRHWVRWHRRAAVGSKKTIGVKTPFPAFSGQTHSGVSA